MKLFKRFSFGLLIALVIFAAATFSFDALACHKISFQINTVPWVAAPTILPAGTQLAVLEGNPKKPGLFTMRVKFPAGTKIMPHWHPQDERVTVLSGSIYIAHGKTFSTTGHSMLYKTGSYYVVPAKTPHFAWLKEEVILQLTGMGPWELHPISQTH